MKNKLSILFIAILPTFLVHPSCKAQPLDNFAGTLTINDTIELGDAPQAVTTKFGQPDNTENWHGEVSGNDYTSYYYNNGAEFDFVDDQLVSFKFTSSSYKIKLGSFELKVGNNISTLSAPFPKSYSKRKPEGTSITLGPADSAAYISVGTSPNGVITEIDLRFIP